MDVSREVITISQDEATTFLIKYHGFNNNTFKGKQGVLDYIRRVGCIQYDPLNVVGRNPDLVLQSKINHYKPGYLYDLLYKDRKLLDGWDKQMSIYLVEDYPKFYSQFYLDMRLKSIENMLTRRKSIDALTRSDEVIDFLKIHGPSKPREIDLGSISKKGSWGHSRHSSVIMDYLYNKGVLLVNHKEGVQKVYNLTNNVLDKSLISETPFSTANDLHKWHILRRIGSVGLLWNKRGGAFQEYYLSNRVLRTDIINELVSTGDLLRVKVEGISEMFYIRSKDLPILQKKEPIKNKMSFLAPLDNMLWDRTLIEELFNFRYRWEVYTPKDKREYGYYVLPILYRNKIIGRFEPMIEKETNTLNIDNWWYEKGVVETKSILKAKKDAISRFCRYLDVNIPRNL